VGNFRRWSMVEDVFCCALKMQHLALSTWRFANANHFGKGMALAVPKCPESIGFSR